MTGNVVGNLYNACTNPPQQSGHYLCKVSRGDDRYTMIRIANVTADGKCIWMGGVRPFSQSEHVTHYFEPAPRPEIDLTTGESQYQLIKLHGVPTPVRAKAVWMKPALSLQSERPRFTLEPLPVTALASPPKSARLYWVLENVSIDTLEPIKHSVSRCASGICVLHEYVLKYI